MRKYTKRIAQTICVIAVVCGMSFSAFADLMVLPIRVVFKDGDRMKSLTLANKSTEEGNFKIEFISMKQGESGAYIAGQKLDESLDLAKMLVFSPRQVYLDAGETQGVRLSMRRPADLADGEYRTHVRVKRVSDEKRTPQKPGKQATILNVNIGIAVPVVLRKGKYDADATISDFKYSAGSVDGKKPAQVEFYLERTGKYSTLGRTLVYWTPPGGEEVQAGIKNGVNVFTEVTRRKVVVPLTEKNISGGTFRVVFEGDDADEGITFDEKTFPVGG